MVTKSRGSRVTAPRRARSAAAKDERRRTILAAARAIFEAGERAFAEVKMADVAARARVAKGTVFLYYPTKEALFLGLLESLLDEWLAEVDAALDQAAGRWSATRVARIIADSLRSRATLTHLLSLAFNVLESNVELERLLAFKLWLLERLSVTGALLERRLPALRAGEGARLLLRLDAVVIGLRQLCDRKPAHEALHADPRLGALVLDFDAELPILLKAVLEGLAGRAPRGPTSMKGDPR